MADYTRQIDTAYRMISKAGFDITIQRYDTGYDPSLGEVVDVGVTEQVLKAINLPSTQGRTESFDNKIFDDQSLVGKKIRFYVAWAFMLLVVSIPYVQYLILSERKRGNRGQ